jgi:EpsI family protein
MTYLRLLLLSALLIVAALLAGNGSGPGAAPPEKKPLRQAFSRFGAWESFKAIPMDAKIVETLNLDDFLYRSYRRDRGNVNLYIGYYRSAKKVGAAHDPLVCFQGQGWEIDSRDSGRYALPNRPDLTIAYSSLLARRQDRREVIVYWFQVNDKTTASTQSQKMAMVLEKIQGKVEDNAFVRLSASVGAGTPEAARARIFAFIEEFYPEFLRYVTKG